MKQVEDGLWVYDFSDDSGNFKLTIQRYASGGERRYAWWVLRLRDGKSETGTESSFYQACATAGVQGANLAVATH